MKRFLLVLLFLALLFPQQIIAGDLALTERLYGYILLQVEQHGEAWYVRQDEDKRYYMKDGSTAYTMMRFFSLGITDSDLAKIPLVDSTSQMLSASSVCSSNTLAGRLKGRILLQVEQHGEAWYVYPKTCRRIYMPDGASAYTIMRFLGLGITDRDLMKIDMGTVETGQFEQSDADTLPSSDQTTQTPTESDSDATSSGGTGTSDSTASYFVDPTDFDPASHGSAHPKIDRGVPTQTNHPYYHQVYRAFSDDEDTWVKEGVLIQDKASVPSVFRRSDGALILYYVDGRYDTMDCQISTDEGETFSDGDCAIYGFREGRAWDPYVVDLQNGYYRMYFISPPESGFGQTKMMSAISTDGINFLQEDGTRFEDLPVIDPTALKIGGTWYLYMGYNPPGEEPSIVIATGVDGLSLEQQDVIDVGGNVPDTITADDGSYHLYYCGFGIDRATSTNGLDWSAGTSMLQPGQNEILCDPSVVKTKDGGFVMYYKVQQGM
jgi:hypothetical protein